MYFFTYNKPTKFSVSAYVDPFTPNSNDPLFADKLDLVIIKHFVHQKLQKTDYSVIMKLPHLTIKINIEETQGANYMSQASNGHPGWSGLLGSVSVWY